MKRLNELFNNINSDCSVNGIKINSKEVKEGDIVEIKFGDKVSKFQIKQVPKVAVKNFEELIKIL